MKNNRILKFTIALTAIGFLGYFIHKGFKLIADTDDIRQPLVESGSTHYPPGTKQTLCYELRSFNKGFSWVAFTNDAKGQLQVAGDADTMYPGLIDQIKGMHRLLEWNATHGPLNMTNPDTLEMLAEAGYVRHKSK